MPNPSYAPSHLWAPGDNLHAADLDSSISGNMNVVYGVPRCALEINAAETPGNSAPAAISWTTVTEDPWNMFGASGNSRFIKIPINGSYLVSASIVWSPNAGGGSVSTTIKGGIGNVNDTTLVGDRDNNPNGLMPSVNNCSRLYLFAANQIVSVWVNNSGTTAGLQVLPTAVINATSMGERTSFSIMFQGANPAVANVPTF